MMNAPAEAVRMLEIPCLVAGVGYSFTVKIGGNKTAERLREVAWSEMHRKIKAEVKQPLVKEGPGIVAVDGLDAYDVDTPPSPTAPRPAAADGTDTFLTPIRRAVSLILTTLTPSLEAGRTWCCGKRLPECSLHLAKGPKWLLMDKWFTMNRGVGRTLKRGKVPFLLTWFSLTAQNVMGPSILSSDNFGFPEHIVPGTMCVLIHNVPEHVKENLRLATANSIYYYEMEYAQGRAELFDLCAWICAVLSLAFGVYLYAIDENVVRGLFVDFTSDNGRLWTVAIERAAFWFFPLLGAAMLKMKGRYVLMSSNLEERIDYAKVADIY
uniref:Uncharacterized protein n=1 Tax=Phytophthora ramorum TaxID=164328 RepID=H3GKX5_PHYRM